MKIMNYRFLGKFLFLDCRYAMGGNDNDLLNVFNLWYAGLDLPGTIGSCGGEYYIEDGEEDSCLYCWAVIDDSLCLGYLYTVFTPAKQVELVAQMEELKDQIKQMYKTL